VEDQCDQKYVARKVKYGGSLNQIHLSIGSNDGKLTRFLESDISGASRPHTDVSVQYCTHEPISSLNLPQHGRGINLADQTFQT
jgi:hypothetical protein